MGRNRAADDAWGDTLDIDWVRQLRASYQDRAARADLSAAVLTSSVVAVLGPAGCGKSVLLSGLADRVVSGAELASGMIFCDEQQTAADLARLLSEQLAHRLPTAAGTAFRLHRSEARAHRLPAVAAGEHPAQGAVPVSARTVWDTELTTPLAALGGPARATLCVDGLDQLAPAAREGLLRHVRHLVSSMQGRVRFVLSARTGSREQAEHLAGAWDARLVLATGLDHDTFRAWAAERGRAPADIDVLDEHHGGDWLLARLLLDLATPNLAPDTPRSVDEAYEMVLERARRLARLGPDAVQALVQVLAAGGLAPVPLVLVHRGLGRVSELMR